MSAEIAGVLSRNRIKYLADKQTAPLEAMSDASARRFSYFDIGGIREEEIGIPQIPATVTIGEQRHTWLIAFPERAQEVDLVRILYPDGSNFYHAYFFLKYEVDGGYGQPQLYLDWVSEDNLLSALTQRNLLNPWIFPISTDDIIPAA